MAMPDHGNIEETPAFVAVHLAFQGFHVVPIAVGSKKPALGNGWQLKASNDIDTVGSWFNPQTRGDGQGLPSWFRGDPNFGVGLVVGKPFPGDPAWRLLSIDIDVDHEKGKDGWASLRELEAEFGELPETLVRWSPSTGAQYLYRYPADLLLSSNTNGTTLGHGIDLKASGQIILPPTLHPDFPGQRFSWEGGETWDPAKIAPIPQWLEDRFRRQAAAREEAAVKARETRASRSSAADDLPGSQYNALVHPAQVMADLCARDPNWSLMTPPSMSREPGKEGLVWMFTWALKTNKRDPAVVVYDYDQHATNYSASAAEAFAGLGEQTPHDSFGLYAIFFHGGDFSAARKQLQAEGIGAEWVPPHEAAWERMRKMLPSPGDPRGQAAVAGIIAEAWAAEGPAPVVTGHLSEPSPRPELAVLVTPQPEQSPSQPPVLEVLPGGEQGAPPPSPPATVEDGSYEDFDGLPFMPVDVLPGWMADQVRNSAAFRQVSVDLPFMWAIVAAATALTYAGVTVRRTENGAKHRLNFYFAGTLPPGHGKSGAYEDCFKRVIWAMQQYARAKATDEVVAAKTTRMDLEARLKKAQREAPRVGQRGWLEVQHLEKQLLDLPVKVEPQWLVNDQTPEALALLISEQALHGMCLVSDEAAPFQTLLGLYSGRNDPNIDVYLQSFDHTPIISARVTERRRLTIEQPWLMFAASPQPSVLQKLGDQRLQQRGLSARFLFVLAHSTVGHREHVNRPELDLAAEKRWSDGLWGLWTSYGGLDMVLSPEALLLHNQWKQALEPRMDRKANGDLVQMVEWYSKLDLSVLRLAAVFTAAKYADVSGTVPVAAMADALAVAEVLAVHAAAVYKLWDAPPVEEQAAAKSARRAEDRLVEWVSNHPEDRFMQRVAHRALQSVFPRVGDLIEALNQIADEGLVRCLGKVPSDTGGMVMAWEILSRPARTPAPTQD